VKPTFLTVVAFLAVIAFLALFLADREMQAGIRRLSNYTFSPRSALDADRSLRRVNERSRFSAAGLERASLPPYAGEQGSEQ